MFLDVLVRYLGEGLCSVASCTLSEGAAIRLMRIPDLLGIFVLSTDPFALVGPERGHGSIHAKILVGDFGWKFWKFALKHPIYGPDTILQEGIVTIEDLVRLILKKPEHVVPRHQKIYSVVLLQYCLLATDLKKHKAQGMSWTR